jgi:Tfp pilus assembly protein PilF
MNNIEALTEEYKRLHCLVKSQGQSLIKDLVDGKLQMEAYEIAKKQLARAKQDLEDALHKARKAELAYPMAALRVLGY